MLNPEPICKYSDTLRAMFTRINPYNLSCLYKRSFEKHATEVLQECSDLDRCNLNGASGKTDISLLFADGKNEGGEREQNTPGIFSILSLSQELDPRDRNSIIDQLYRLIDLRRPPPSSAAQNWRTCPVCHTQYANRKCSVKLHLPRPRSMIGYPSSGGERASRGSAEKGRGQRMTSQQLQAAYMEETPFQHDANRQHYMATYMDNKDKAWYTHRWSIDGRDSSRKTPKNSISAPTCHTSQFAFCIPRTVRTPIQTGTKLIDEPDMGSQSPSPKPPPCRSPVVCRSRPTIPSNARGKICATALETPSYVVSYDKRPSNGKMISRGTYISTAYKQIKKSNEKKAPPIVKTSKI